MEIPQDDFERLMVLEQARHRAVAEYARDPTNAQNLTRLGRTLVELSQFAQGSDCNDMLEEAVSKLEEALKVEPNSHESRWWLGNALTTQGFSSGDAAKAAVCFDRAAESFRHAIKEDPSNEAYKKSLEVSLKGPELFVELQKQMALQQAVHQPPAAGPAQVGKKKKGNDFLYDVAGWVILTVGLVAWLSILSARAPPPPAAAK